MDPSHSSTPDSLDSDYANETIKSSYQIRSKEVE